MKYTGAKKAAQVLRSLGCRNGSPDGSHKDGYTGSIAREAGGVKASGRTIFLNDRICKKHLTRRKL